MLILKKINNNVALASNDAGEEIVVFGKGVGFPKTPYELEDGFSACLPMLMSGIWE